MSDLHEIRTLLAPISGSNLLLPGNVVAEVVAFTELATLQNAPDWVLGELDWNGWQIPVVNFALLARTSHDSSVSPRSRILVVKTMTESASILHVGFIISGMPRLKTLSTANLAETGSDTETCVFSHVTVDEQPAVIPDLDELAKTIEDAVYRNA